MLLFSFCFTNHDMCFKEQSCFMDRGKICLFFFLFFLRLWSQAEMSKQCQFAGCGGSEPQQKNSGRTERRVVYALDPVHNAKGSQSQGRGPVTGRGSFGGEQLKIIVFFKFTC